MGLEQSIDKLADAMTQLAAALGDKGAEALAREQKWRAKADETFPPETTKLQHPDEDPEPSDPPIKLETVRAKLAKISQAGKQKEVKQLLTDLGYPKLSAVPPKLYPDLMKKADEIA